MPGRRAASHHRYVETPEALDREVHESARVGLVGPIGSLEQRRHVAEFLQQRRAGLFASAPED
jgi:hypothetical protein